MKKLSLALLAGASALLIGCGGGSSSTSDDVTILRVKDTTIKASDAYVVKLITPATAVCDGVEYNTTTVNDGNITFELPSDVDVNSCKFYIPGDAVVDTDGDGNYSSADLPIRMPLSVEGVGIANPLTTTAMEQNNTQAMEVALNFDPVKAKEALLLNPNDEVNKTLVALSDAIADTIKEANQSGVDPKEVMQNIDLQNALSALQENNSSDVNVSQVVNNAITPVTNIAPIDKDKIIQKTEDELELIQTLHQHVTDNNLTHEEALSLVLMSSDGDANVTIDANTSIEEIHQIKEQIENELEEKHKEIFDQMEETLDHETDDNMSNDDMDDSDNNVSNTDDNVSDHLTDTSDNMQDNMENQEDDSYNPATTTDNDQMDNTDSSDNDQATSNSDDNNDQASSTSDDSNDQMTSSDDNSNDSSTDDNSDDNNDK